MITRKSVILAMLFVAAMLASFLPAIELTQNSLFLTDMPTGRIVRVSDFTSAGWEEGPSPSVQQLNWPWHFTFDSGGRIYIADRDNGRIVRMDDFAGRDWKAFSGVGANILVPLPRTSGTNESGNFVSSVFVDTAGRIYMTGVAGGGRLVRIDDMDGNGWTTFAPGGSSLKSVVVDRFGRIYFSDNANHRITRMNDMQGTGFVSLGSLGNGVNQFDEPEGLALDSENRIYVADETNHRIVRFNDMTGDGWTTFGSFGNGTGQFRLPQDIQVDNMGRIYIADTINQRIVRINSMSGDGWVEFGRAGCYGCDTDITGSFLMAAPRGIRVLGSGPAVTYDAIFPQVAVGGGYRTSIVQVNPGTSKVDATVTFTKNQFEPFSVNVDSQSATTFTRSIPPMGMVRMAATSTGGVGAGYVTIRSGEEINGVSLFQTMAGDTVISEAGVGLSRPTDNFTVYIDNTNNAQTGYAVVNAVPAWEEPPSSVQGFMDAQLTLTLRSKAGAVVETKTIPFSRGQHIAEFASQRFPATAGAGFEGSIEFSSVNITHRVRAVALRYDNTGQDAFTAIPVIMNARDPNDPASQTGVHKTNPPVEPTTLYYPQVADGGSYRTNFVLVNPSSVATTATLEFFGDDGAPLSFPIDGSLRTSQAVSLNAHAVAHIVTDGTSSAVKVGWARVTTPEAATFLAIGGSAIFQTVVNGRITSEAGVSSSPVLPHFLTPVDSKGFAKSGIAISNPNSANVNITFRLRNASGQIVATTVRTLSSRAHLAQFFTQLFTAGSDQFEGTLEVSSSGGSISAVALRYDNPDGSAFATMPVLPMP